jgi:hypothetical protein
VNTEVVRNLAQQVVDRDHEVLSSLERFRLLDTKQIQRLHFIDHLSELAAARACNRALLRLRDLGLVAALERRVGGARKGSASYIWQLAATGERLLRLTRGQAHRRRFMEPGATFVNHTLAVNEVAVSLLEADRTRPGFIVDELTTEPRNWRSFLGPSGETRWLKPDLTVVTVLTEENDEFEEHAFLELDLGTEHLPRIRNKCQIYAAYAATGAYQADHGLFPAVIWISPDKRRRAALAATISGLDGPLQGVFGVASPEAYLRQATRAK